MRDTSRIVTVAPRDRYLIWAYLALVTTLCWTYLTYLARHPSPSPEPAGMMAALGMPADRPWTAADALFTFSMWTAMMIGMMSPSAAPVLMAYSGAQAARTRRRLPLNVLLFGLGYLSVWAGFGGVATFFQWTLQRAALLSSTMAVARPSAAATVLIASGLYQFTPVKNACLTACHSPLDFLMTSWREGAAGAFVMGTRHGVFCLGCCWSLMFVLFAVGVMNLSWVAGLAAVVLIEKLLPAGVLVARATGAAMIISGAYLLAHSL